MSTLVRSLKTPTGSTALPDAGAYDHLKDSQGRFRTQSLFIEYQNDKYPAPFTLKEYDHKGALSMYRKYIEIGDPTEYSQAIGLLGSWRHWEMLTSSKWFKPFLTQWRNELKVKFESDRYREMKTTAQACAQTPQGIQATKWLAERYNDPEVLKRGRPSKAEKAQALKQLQEEQELLNDEASRLGLD